MITPISPIGLSPISGPADAQTPRVTPEPLGTQVPQARKAEPEKAEEPARKHASAGGLKQPVPAYD